MNKLPEIEALLKKLELRHDNNDIEQLTTFINYLQKKDLSKLSDRLLSSTTPHKFLEALTEVKFTFQLLKNIPNDAQYTVTYEPTNTKRPIDLVITFEEITYFIQIKSLSNSIRESQQIRTVREIRKQLKSILCKRELSIHVSNNFMKNNVSKMLELVKENLTINDDKKIYFQDGSVRAEIQFQTPKKVFRDHLALYPFCDLDAVEITG